MTIWKVLAIVGMLASLVLFAVSLIGYEMIFILGAAFGAANFSVLCLILDRLPPKID